MIKRILQVIVLLIFIGFIAIQFIRPDFTNPPTVQAETMEATMQVPENVEQILTRSCKDCHSNETVYPWYSKIQPSAWFLAGHISNGRRHLNLSTWGTSQPNRQKRKLAEICEQVESKEMPLPSYLWIHQSAKMSDEEIKILCDWSKAEAEKIDVTPTPAPAQ